MFESLLQDLHYGAVVLRKNPVFSTVAILVLAFGTGVNSATFSVLNGVILRPLQYADPDRLVMVWGSNLKSGRFQNPISAPDFFDYQFQNRLLADLAGFASEEFNIGRGDEPVHAPGSMVSANFFSTLGVTPALGRFFSPGKDAARSDRLVVMSHGLWQRSFGGDKAIIGQIVQLNGGGSTIVGVTAPRFISPEPTDELWVNLCLAADDRLRIPSAMSLEDLRGRSRRFMLCVGRLKPFVALSQARTELQLIAGEIEKQNPQKNNGVSVNVIPLFVQLVGDIQASLLLLMVLVGFVLLIACSNMSNLLLSRAVSRKRKIAVQRLEASQIRLTHGLVALGELDLGCRRRGFNLIRRCFIFIMRREDSFLGDIFIMRREDSFLGD